MFACLRSYLRNYKSNLRHIFVNVAYGRGSVLLWRRSDRLRISGFIGTSAESARSRRQVEAMRLTRRLGLGA